MQYCGISYVIYYTRAQMRKTFCKRRSVLCGILVSLNKESRTK